MFKFIFEILTDPLGLPIEWYWEYLILAVIGVVAYAVAYRFVGDMYSGGMIDGSTSGSFFHWLIRLILFVALWAVTYPVPPLNEQNAIVKHIDSVLSKADAVIADKKAQLATLDEYKKSLIFEYVTGKKEVI